MARARVGVPPTGSHTSGPTPPSMAELAPGMVENYPNIGGRKTPIPPETATGSIDNFNSDCNGDGNKVSAPTAANAVVGGMGIGGAGSTARDTKEDEEWDEERICDSLRRLEEMHNKVCCGFGHYPATLLLTLGFFKR